MAVLASVRMSGSANLIFYDIPTAFEAKIWGEKEWHHILSCSRMLRLDRIQASINVPEQ